MFVGDGAEVGLAGVDDEEAAAGVVANDKLEKVEVKCSHISLWKFKRQ